MRRSLNTLVLVLSLSASSVGFAAAAETPAPPVAVASAGASAPGSVVRDVPAAPPADAVGVDSAQEPAAPTAGADLVMWNAAPAAPVETSANSDRRVSRLRRFASGIVNRSSAIASSLTRSAMRFIGTPYVFGGTHTTGFDCSGYVQHVFAMLGFRLPRTADAQYDAGHRIAAAMAPGDLVFFHTYAPGVSHVGIYLGHSRFIHSSSSHGVSISSLHDRYWAPRYLGAKRVFGS